MSRLIISLGSLPLLSVEIEKGRTRLGRARENDVVLPLPEVAPFHAEILAVAGGFEARAAEDEVLLVNGREVERAALADGDLLALGGYQLRWRSLEADAAGAAPAGSGVRATRPINDRAGDEPPMPTSVRVVTGPDAGRRIELAGPATVLGRSPDCDLVLSDDSVSWRHLSLEPVADGQRARDLGSSNGSFVDGRRIEAAIVGPGTELEIGRTRLVVGDAAEGGPSESGSGLAELVGGSAAMQQVYARLREASTSRVPVLLLGETGTGKELAARAIHSIGGRAGAAFVPVNCAAIPREVIEDELFGHVRGAFTGATADRAGAFERADGGTVFLDEIGELAQDLQTKLLRVVEDGEVPRLGGSVVRCDFRVITATNRDLAADTEAGRFRRDLYYRIAVEQIRMPSLWERPEDLPELIHTFLRNAGRDWQVSGAERLQVDREAVDQLAGHGWPGNVRELRNLVLRAAVRARGSVIDQGLVRELLREPAPPAAEAKGSAATLEEIEREAIRHALHDCSGRRRCAARRLGIAESTLYEKIRRYGLGKEGREG